MVSCATTRRQVRKTRIPELLVLAAEARRLDRSPLRAVRHH